MGSVQQVGHSDPVEDSVTGDHFLPGAGLFVGGAGWGKEKFVCFCMGEGPALIQIISYVSFVEN